MKSWERFGEIWEENWWSFKENLVKSYEQFGEKLDEILGTIQWNSGKNVMKSCYHAVIFSHMLLFEG